MRIFFFFFLFFFNNASWAVQTDQLNFENENFLLARLIVRTINPIRISKQIKFIRFIVRVGAMGEGM